jgi:hypothetical protein
MFRCEVTGKMSKSGEKLHKVVVATRNREYKEWVYNEDTRRSEELVVGHGWEIVRELNASEEGEATWNAMTPDAQAAWVKRYVF